MSNSGIIVKVKAGTRQGEEGTVYHRDQTKELKKAGKVIVTFGKLKILKDARKLQSIGFID